MIEIRNSMDDTLAFFETEGEASRFESAVELIASYQTSRSNPANALAEHRLLSGISGIDEIIDKVSIAIFGDAKTKVTDRAAPFIHFFFAQRSGNLDNEFFYTLAAFTKKETRRLIGLFRSEYAKHTEGELIGGVIESSPDLWHIGDFHNATPYMQVLYSYKLLGVLDRLEVEPHDESKHSHTREEHLQINDVDNFHFQFQLYQSCSVQLCHINESFRVFGLGPIPERGGNIASEQNKDYRRSVMSRTKRFDKWLDLTVLEPLGVSLRLMQLTPTHFTKSTVQHMYHLSAIFTKIGDGFDEIQWGGLGLEKSLAVIERVALKSEPLTAEFIYKTYVLRQDVGTSYLRWALPLLLDMWRYQSRPSGNPLSVKLTLEIANAIEDKPDVLEYILTKTMRLAKKKQPINEGVLQDVLYEDDFRYYYKVHDDADRATALILLLVKRMFPNDLPAIKHSKYFINADGWEYTFWAETVDDSLRALFSAVITLDNKISSDHPKPVSGFADLKGYNNVEIIALEKYNPLSLFVGHSQVSNCCIYPGSQGEECGVNAFLHSGVDGKKSDKVEYRGQSHMVLGYSHDFNRFVGSNWAWRPAFVYREKYEDGGIVGYDYEPIEDSHVTIPPLSQMFFLDQFELSVWATNILYEDQVGFSEIQKFVDAITSIYAPNYFNYLVANIESSYTAHTVNTAFYDSSLKEHISVECAVSPVNYNMYTDIDWDEPIDTALRISQNAYDADGLPSVEHDYSCPTDRSEWRGGKG